MANQDQSKLYWIIGGVVGVIVVVALIFGLTRGKKSDETAQAPVESAAPAKKKRISAPQNVIALGDRPVVKLRPFSKDGGRFVSIEVQSLGKTATSAEYEIVYNVIGANAVDKNGRAISDFDAEAEGGLQAFIGELDLSQLPTSSENRFGTCSAGGACINNSVDYGTLTLNFDAAEKFGVKTNWTYFESAVNRTAMHDGNFALEAEGLEKAEDYLLMQMMGLPAGIQGEVVMLPDDGRDNGTWPVAYQLSFTKTPSGLKTGKVDFGSNFGEQVAVYDGQSWTNYDLMESVPVGADYIYALVTVGGGQ
ncbi:hypothetical protein IJJ08_00070 [bacterium]|nr:hypothetical protein [bacterium]